MHSLQVFWDDQIRGYDVDRAFDMHGKRKVHAFMNT